jgi:hypothetical protein
MSDYEDLMISKPCENSGVTVDDLQGVEEDTISCSNSSPSDLFMELEVLENALSKLKIEQCELKRNKNHIHSSFIRIIPSEIIAVISGFAITDFTITDSSPDAILLSSVCSDWRRAVVGTPELWSTIKIDLPFIQISDNKEVARSTLKLPRLADFIDEWLARSGQLPLNISLYYDHEVPWHSLTLKAYIPIFNILNKYSSRWHILNLSIPPHFHQSLQPDSLPLLEQLHITCKSIGLHLTFPPTPRLNTVEIHPGRNIEFVIPIDNGIHWNTVTHVSLESITSCDCLALLRLSPQLLHCTFHMVEDFTEEPLESPVLSSLTYLSLHHRRDTSRILDNVKLPCLETLVMYNVITDPVIAFIERSSCSLRTLSLLSWHIRKTNKLIPLLQFLSPSLTRLAISRLPSPIRGTKNYLSILTRIYTSQSEVVGNDFLPHLEVFEYREESPSTLESSMLSNLPSGNYPIPATSIALRSAYISTATITNKEVPPAISVILQRLEEEGILTYT